MNPVFKSNISTVLLSLEMTTHFLTLNNKGPKSYIGYIDTTLLAYASEDKVVSGLESGKFPNITDNPHLVLPQLG